MSVVRAFRTPLSASCAGVRITSPAFDNNGSIPAKFTCDGAGMNPALQFFGVPAAAKSLALIIDDPDAPDPKAPQRVWVHWVVYNLPPETKGLPENAGSQGLPNGAVTGTNDRKQNAYHGPCPPIGRHRYFHKLYALDIALPPAPLTKAEFEAAMQGHVLAQAELMGTYQKGDP
jgi:Raf kinase inhibitor-like YbhB/YbcL family protein